MTRGDTIPSWDADGVAAVEVAGDDRRAVLDALLREVLTLAVPAPVRRDPTAGTRSAPIRGAGDDLAALAADLIEDLLAQIEDFGAGSLAVALDGVVRRDDGGFVAWGYLETAAGAAPRLSSVRLLGMPEVEERPAQFTARARLARPAAD